MCDTMNRNLRVTDLLKGEVAVESEKAAVDLRKVVVSPKKVATDLGKVPVDSVKKRSHGVGKSRY